MQWKHFLVCKAVLAQPLLPLFLLALVVLPKGVESVMVAPLTLQQTPNKRLTGNGIPKTPKLVNT
jgi:hypothetical protein